MAGPLGLLGGWRRGGNAVDLPRRTSRAALLAEIDALRSRGVIRKAKPRKLHLTEGLVEFATESLLVPQAGALVCGQAAMEAATGCNLNVLGVDPWTPSARASDNVLHFVTMNAMLASSSGLGKAFIFRRPRVKLSSAHEVFARSTGVFVLIVYHVPGDEDIGEQMPFGPEVTGLRCAATPHRTHMHTCGHLAQRQRTARHSAGAIPVSTKWRACESKRRAGRTHTRLGLVRSRHLLSLC